MNRRSTAVAATLAAVLGLPACSYLGLDRLLHDYSKDYLSASSVELMRMPPGLDAPTTDPSHPVPGDANQPESSAPPFELGPPQRLFNPALGEVRMQRLGERFWIVVDLPPDRVWPLVRAFFSDSQLPLAKINTRSGSLETGWLKPEHHPPERYRLKLIPGLRPDSSEVILVQHNGKGTSWPESASDPARRDEMLKALATYMVDAPTAKISRLAASLTLATERSRIEDNAAGHPQLLIDLRYDRGWATLGFALEHAEFKIVDRDRSTGIYYLEQPSNKPRLSPLRRLLPQRRKSQGKEQSADVDQLPPERRLELRVQRDGDERVRSSFHGPNLTADVARVLLKRLRRKLP